MYDLGDTVALAFTTRDSTGALANATAVTLTVTEPDGTSDTYSVSPTTTGLYRYAYAPTSAGRHSVRWLATGTNAGAYADVFDVVSGTDARLIISLADARDVLNLAADNTTHDEELRFYIRSATEVIESIVGAVLVRTVEDTATGGGTTLALSTAPVVSVTSVTEDGTALSAGDWSLDAERGLITRMSGNVADVWSNARHRGITVTYRAGRPDIPANILDAAREYLKHRWQQSQQGKRPSFGGAEAGDMMPGSGYAIPRRVLELLQGVERVPGFA